MRGVTTEYDFSELSPHMLYFAHDYEMGNEDVYDRVFDGEHRDVVKQAFNAMIQSSSQLNLKPDKINIDGLEMSWMDIRQRILDAHKPIQYLFFTGIGINFSTRIAALPKVLCFSLWSKTK